MKNSYYVQPFHLNIMIKQGLFGGHSGFYLLRLAV
jgi:hypothetical protein